MSKIVILSLCAISIGICSAKMVAPPPVPILRTAAGADDTKDVPIETDDTISGPTKPAARSPTVSTGMRTFNYKSMGLFPAIFCQTDHPAIRPALPYVYNQK